ncbi:MAG: EpsG family protein [Clostridia bacterium]|nr:EpsG family protein [Clostridia bacterium]
MIIYILLVLLILLLPKLKISKKIYCIIIGISITLIVGFRDISMGMNDTQLIYLPIFTKLSSLSILESCNYIKKNGLEFGFYILTRLYLLFTSNYRIYLIILAAISNFFITRFIYKYSNNPSFSFILFFSLNYFSMEFTLLRHYIALAIIIFSYDFIVDKKFFKFCITVIIAAFFHKTAIIFLIAYPLRYLKTGYKNLALMIFALLVSMTVGDKLLYIAVILLKHKKYLRYLNSESNNLTFFLMNFLIYIYFFLGFKKNKKELNYNILMNIYTIGICISTCTLFIGEAFRLSTYFTIFSIIILPNIMELIKDNTTRKIFVFSFEVLLILYFFFFTMNNTCIYPYILGELNILI